MSRPTVRENPRNIACTTGAAGFLESLYTGRLRWDLVERFPDQDPDDRAIGDGGAAELEALLRSSVDPAEVDAKGELPGGLVEALRARGYLDLQVDPDLGGRGFSAFNTFRMIQCAASWSMPVGLVMAVQNAIGVAALLPSLPPGELRDLLRRRVAGGIISGGADTEPHGAANARPRTIAVPTADGSGFVLSGEKIHIGNAPIADFIDLTATLRDGDGERTRIFFVETDLPGFSVAARHEFMGLRGFPNGALALDGVVVPRACLLPEEDQTTREARLNLTSYSMILRGRLFLIAAPSLALAKLCVRWMRDFVVRRSVDGLGLADYPLIQRHLALAAADVFAIESFVRWGLIGVDHKLDINLGYEHYAVKNFASVACWRTVERAMSVLAAEGYETVASKARRGAPPLPLERAFRDARGMRISGGVDFLMYYWLARRQVFSHYYPEPENAAEIEADFDPASVPEVGLGPANRRHLRHAARAAHSFARACLSLSRRYPDPAALFERQLLLCRLGQIATELCAMGLVLARAAASAGQEPAAESLADTYCAAARGRIEGWTASLAEAEAADFAEAARPWLEPEAVDRLTAGILG